MPSAPHLFLILQSDALARGGARFSLCEADMVEIGRAGSLRADRKGRTLSIGVPDRRMSSTHLQIERVLDGWLAVDRGSKNGTFVDARRIDRQELTDGALLEAGCSFFTLRTALPPGPDALDATATLRPDLAADLERARLIAASRLPVLLRGESGTGKEVLARAIHRSSHRPGPFVAVNCGALPAALVESELFGHMKGAFTGAVDARVGLIRAADGGTLLLDEIGDLPLAAQAALLRVLQEEEVMPIGATRALPVDLRVVSSTHRPLEDMVTREEFRADLLTRLSGFTIVLPPLRERREDLGLLMRAILQKSGARVALTFKAARALLSYRWPGNVRELENSLERAAILALGAEVDLPHLPEPVQAGGLDPAPGLPLNAADQRRRDELEAALRDSGGNVTAAARSLGKARSQVQRWLRRYGLDPASFRR